MWTNFGGRLIEECFDGLLMAERECRLEFFGEFVNGVQLRIRKAGKGGVVHFGRLLCC